MNPFKNKFSGNYSEYVRLFLKSIGCGESKKFDLKGKSVASARMTLNYCNNENKKIKTIVNSDGELWVKYIN